MTEFLYNIEGLINKCEADIIYNVEGTKKDLESDLVEDNDSSHLKRWLQQIAADMFVVLHKKGNGIEDSYQWDTTVEGEEGKFIIYTIQIPTDLDPNLVAVIDTCIETAIITNLTNRWMKKRGQFDPVMEDEAKSTITRVRNLINYKTSIKKTYDWY